MPETPERLLTVHEAAALAGVSRQTIWRRVRAGELPAVRVGRNPHSPVRIDPDAFDSWLFGEPTATAKE
jgi:excisionase family DNA binding protein